MSTDETNIHKQNGEFIHYDQTIIVTFDIEDVLITYIINTVKRFLDICKQVHLLLSQ